MPTKMVLYYNQLNAGFSETYYHASNDPVTLANNFTSAFYQKMVKFRSTDTILEAARFSATTPPRKSFLIRPYPKPQGTSGATGDVGPDVVSTTAVFALQATDGSTRRIFMRGLADQDVKRDTFGNDTPTANLISGTNAMFLELFKQGFSIRVSNRPPNAGLTWQNIVLVGHTDATNSNSSYFVLDNQVIRFAKNDVVQFNGIPADLPRFPRKAVITGVVLDGGVEKYYVDYSLPGGVQVATGKMKVTMSTYSLATISLWQFERFSEHKTGRPFGSLRGRARVA
jgi:hypothetical protein